jgi:hypothetical protein
MKYLIPVVLFAVLVGGCKTRVDGQLNVTKELTLRAFSGDKHLIKVGTYTADLAPNGSSRIALRINQDNDERFNFAIPEGSKFPDNGTVLYTAAQLGQAVDISATVATTVTNTPTQEQYSSCSYQEPVQVCYPVPNGGMACSIQYRTVWGYQWERFYDRITNKNVLFNIFEPAATEASAQFLGNSSTADRIIISRSLCR